MDSIPSYHTPPNKADNSKLTCVLRRTTYEVIMKLLVILLILGMVKVGMSEGLAEGEIYEIEGLGMRMIWVEGGTFMMGSPEGEEGRDEDEGVVEVKITKGYWLGSKEVTQEQWAEVMGSNPSEFRDQEGLPVDSVNYFMCIAFCDALTKRERAAGRLPKGYRYVIPTEAQWEYASRERGKNAGIFCYGDKLSSHDANIHGLSPYGTEKKGPLMMKTRQAGSYKPNALGFYDMHGNVYEWCRDWYGPYPKKPVEDPSGPSTGNRRVIRGGSWMSKAVWCRTANRLSLIPGYRINTIGLRLCLEKSDD